MSKFTNHYQVLGVGESSSLQEIKTAYKRLVLKTHPDRYKKSKDNEKLPSFVSVQLAYEILRSKKRRALFNQQLERTKKEIEEEKENETDLYKLLDRQAPVMGSVDIDEMDWDGYKKVFHYPCPCGGRFEVSQEDLEEGIPIAICDCCSLAIYVIYDIEEDGDDDEDEVEN
ncbi:diphthamide biosynthesis protein [Anaeramoeba flamelloides]|uniref:Diphthamide biosynthesis protein n=1 Tax=Anaeramoeba flamelloides TaxID=1746091 RepID=A0AAV7YSN4_9EUKA|nr:diphthamide biosynthesis protein [Anaeramoeba flamelloides]